MAARSTGPRTRSSVLVSWLGVGCALVGHGCDESEYRCPPPCLIPELRWDLALPSEVGEAFALDIAESRPGFGYNDSLDARLPGRGVYELFVRFGERQLRCRWVAGATECDTGATAHFIPAWSRVIVRRGPEAVEVEARYTAPDGTTTELTHETREPAYVLPDTDLCGECPIGTVTSVLPLTAVALEEGFPGLECPGDFDVGSELGELGSLFGASQSYAWTPPHEGTYRISLQPACLEDPCSPPAEGLRIVEPETCQVTAVERASTELLLGAGQTIVIARRLDETFRYTVVVEEVG